MEQINLSSYAKYFQELSKKEVTCPDHGKYEQIEFRVVKDQSIILTKCPVCKAIKEHNNTLDYIAQGKREYHEKLVTKLFGHSMIPPKMTGRTLDNFIVNDDNKSNLEKIKQYTIDIERNLAAGTGFIFFGNKGTGKSHLSCAIAEIAISKHYSAMFVTMDNILNDFKAAYSENSSVKDKIKNYCQIDLLIIDEIIFSLDEKELKNIANLINERYNNKKSTILITNLDLTINPLRPNDPILSQLLGERLMDRFRETNRALKFTGESFRRYSHGSNEQYI